MTTEYRTTLNQNGRIVIPAAIRKTMSLEAGDELLLSTESNTITVTSLKQRLADAQAQIRQYTKGKGSLSKELIAMRREEAKSE